MGFITFAHDLWMQIGGTHLMPCLGDVAEPMFPWITVSVSNFNKNPWQCSLNATEQQYHTRRLYDRLISSTDASGDTSKMANGSNIQRGVFSFAPMSDTASLVSGVSRLSSTKPVYFVEALFDYEATSEGEITLSKGSVLHVRSALQWQLLVFEIL